MPFVSSQLESWSRVWVWEGFTNTASNYSQAFPITVNQWRDMWCCSPEEHTENNTMTKCSRCVIMSVTEGSTLLQHFCKKVKKLKLKIK